MRPTLLPPLAIPKRHSAAPVLLISHYREQTARPVSECLPPYPPPPPYSQPQPQPEIGLGNPVPASQTQPRPEIKIDDFDDIDVFKFYNPCLLPPSPISASSLCTANPRPRPPPAEPPAQNAWDPSPGLAPGLRRSKPALSRRTLGYRQPSKHTGTPQPRSRSASRSRRPESMPPTPSAPLLRSESIQKSPLTLQAPQPRRVNLLQWGEEFNSLGVIPDGEWGDFTSASAVPAALQLFRPQGEEITTSPEEEDEEEQEEGRHGCYTPSIYSVDEGNYYGRQGQEKVALRELWDVVDDFLGPGTNPKECDAKSAASNLDGLGNTFGGWYKHGRQQGSGGERITGGVYGAQQGTAWWRAFRRGMLLS